MSATLFSFLLEFNLCSKNYFTYSKKQTSLHLFSISIFVVKELSFMEIKTPIPNG